MNITRKCAHCGKEFTPQSGSQKYCCEQCADTAKPKTVKASRYVPTKRKGRGMKYYSKFFPSSMIFSLNKGTLAFETGNTRSVLNILIL